MDTKERELLIKQILGDIKNNYGYFDTQDINRGKFVGMLAIDRIEWERLEQTLINKYK